MKFLIPLSFLIMTLNPSLKAETHDRRPTYQRYSSLASLYCQEERFQSYINLAQGMRDYVTPREYERVYLPLKVRAAKAKVTLKNFGPLSATTHASLLEIVKFVVVNEKEFDKLWEVEAFFPVAQDLMEMTQALARDLQ